MRQLSGFSTFLFCIRIYSAILPSNRYSALEFEKLRLPSSLILPSPNRQTRLARLNLSLQPSSIHSCVIWKDALSAGSCYGSAMAMISCWKRYQQLPTMNLGQFLLTLVRPICPCRMVLLRMRRSTVKKSFSSCIWQYLQGEISPLEPLVCLEEEGTERDINDNVWEGVDGLMSTIQNQDSSFSSIKSKIVNFCQATPLLTHSFPLIQFVAEWKEVFIFKSVNTFFKTFRMLYNHHIINTTHIHILINTPSHCHFPQSLDPHP